MKKERTTKQVMDRIDRDLGLTSKIIGTWSMVFGVILFIQGDPAWGAYIYDYMQKFPGAPETIGVIMIISGFSLFVFDPIKPKIAGSAGILISLSALWIGGGFLAGDIFLDHETAVAQPPAVTYLGLVFPITAVRSWSLLRSGV